ncbi:MAG: hypothetical protein HYX94_08115 [Chloroflexi bacterium]|nr:hypothetical protein [Chloroflexota bacterium]
MEEDVAGPEEEIIGETYTTCSRCGRPVPRKQTILTCQPESEETRSEQEELCPQCREELQREEQG